MIDVYQGAFTDRENVEREIGWQINGEIIFARYDQDDYDGVAVVVWKADDKLWMVEGSHCSCDGLSEGMRQVEEVTVDVAKHLFERGYGYWKDKDFQQIVMEQLA